MNSPGPKDSARLAADRQGKPDQSLDHTPPQTPVTWVTEGGIVRLSRLTNGWVMCCHCFTYTPPERLAPVEDEPGKVWDVCVSCAAIENRTATHDDDDASEQPDGDQPGPH